MMISYDLELPSSWIDEDAASTIADSKKLILIFWW